MAELIKEFSEPQGVQQIFGIGDMGVETRAYPGESTVWDTGRPVGGDWIDTGPNGVTFRTDPESLSYVRYELWTGPPPQEQDWTHAWEGTIYLASGRIAVITASNGEAEYYTEFSLPRPETTWQTRVQAKYPAATSPRGFPQLVGGPILFKIQFWLEDH